MFQFDPAEYGPALAAVLPSDVLWELGPGSPNNEAYGLLSALTVESAFPDGVADEQMASACISAAWLMHDYLDESHTISQNIETNTGSYWHGIMHRREPDFSNSGYWFRRVGSHPVFESLCGDARELATVEDCPSEAAFLAGQREWDPFAFIDLCEASYHGRSTAEILCRRVQQQECWLLLDDCYRAAVG